MSSIYLKKYLDIVNELYESLIEANITYEGPFRNGNWTSYYSSEPVVMGNLTGNKPMYVAKLIYKENRKGEQIFMGTGNTQGAARDNAFAQANIAGDDTVDDNTKYKKFIVDFNSEFGSEYYDPRGGGYFKFMKNDSGDTVLVMASNAYFDNFRDDLIDLGFRKAYFRHKKNDGNTLSFSINQKEIKDYKLTPHMRYTLEEIENDADGNRMFILNKDSRVMDKKDRMRLGMPGLTVSGIKQ